MDSNQQLIRNIADAVCIIHTSNVHKRHREVRIRHLQTVIQHPQRTAEAVADTWKTAARRSVCLKHVERFSCGLCDVSRVSIGRNDPLTRSMCQVLRKFGLRIRWRTKVSIWECSCTVIIWIAVEQMNIMILHKNPRLSTYCSTDKAPISGEYEVMMPVFHTDSGLQLVDTLGTIRLLRIGIFESAAIAFTITPTSPK